MKQRLLLGIWMMVAMCSLVWAQAQPLQTNSLAVGSATVMELKGKVYLRSPKGEALSPKPGMTLPAESTIETAKGSVVLNLQDGSQLLVKSSSRLLLKSPDAGTGFYLQQWLGKIIVKVQKRMSNTPSFRMGTPTAVISVRGTRFEVEVKNKRRTDVSVYEGLVEVRGVSGDGAPVLLAPGFSTSVQENHPPQPPTKVELPEGGSRRSGRGSRVPGDPAQSPSSISSGDSHGSGQGEDDVTE